MGRSSPYTSVAEERARIIDGADRPAIPFLILTGFLGAGKTTLLNRLLAAPQGRRIAVLVNDVGAINIDRSLITQQAGDLIELSGGCVCCEIDLQRDLFTGVEDVVERAKPDVVVLETTGIADPRVLLTAFDEVPARRALVVPSGVICVVDAEVGLAGEARVEWTAQVQCADRIVLTKVAGDTSSLQARVRALSTAELAAFPDTPEGTQLLARFLLEEKTPSSLRTKAHRHSQLSAFAFAEEGELLEAPLRSLLESLGDTLVRCKGFVRANGRWLYVERAGKQLSFTERSHDASRSELVLIVDAGSITEEALQRRLWACRAGADVTSA